MINERISIQVHGRTNNVKQFSNDYDGSSPFLLSQIGLERKTGDN